MTNATNVTNTNERSIVNRGARSLARLAPARYPDAGPAVRAANPRAEHAVDLLLVNPPSPDGAIYIRSQHRVGRRSRENMIWPQVSLAQLAAVVGNGRSVRIADAIAERLSWSEFEALLRELRPRYYLTQLAAPTLTNDMRGVFLAKSLGARTIAFGTHVTPLPRETLAPYPALDFALRGEPEETIAELLSILDSSSGAAAESPERPLSGASPIASSDPGTGVARGLGRELDGRLEKVAGLVWRRGGEIVVNADRPFIPDLDDLPLPRYDLLPLSRYRVPMIDGPYCFVVTSRGCPGGCAFCIKHVSYQSTVRLRSAAKIHAEIRELARLGVKNVHMYADIFTISRDQVTELCELLIREGPPVRWTCNSRVDFVDPELLRLMRKAGCWLVSWGLESGSPDILRRAHKGIDPDQAERAIRWAREAGIKNWGYFIVGLPGETEATIRQTIDFAKRLPLDIALFHIAAPYPGTPFFFEVLENGWFRPGTRWEEVDMDCSTVLDYPGLKTEDLEAWQKRAFREWALRPGPFWTYLKMRATPGGLRSALEIGIRHLAWAKG